MKSHTIFFKLCSVLIFYAPFVYSIDLKCFSVFEPKEGQEVLSEDIQGEYGVSYKEGTPIEWVKENEEVLYMKLMKARAVTIAHDRETDRLLGGNSIFLTEDVKGHFGIVYKRGTSIAVVDEIEERLERTFGMPRNASSYRNIIDKKNSQKFFSEQDVLNKEIPRTDVYGGGNAR